MITLQKLKSFVSNRALREAYARWLFARVALGGSPVLNIGEKTKLAGWISFSEYWSFQDAVPQSEHLFMKKCLSESTLRPIAFDIGANIGAFTCLLAASGAEQVHAFEPIPETFCRLEANVKLNGLLGCCRLNCLAIGKEDGLVTFQVQEDSPATNQLALSNHRGAGKARESLQRVALTSLDAYCLEAGIEQIDLLKVDVEGMETHVMQGAKTLFQERRVRAVLIEVCPANLQSVGRSPADLCREFETARYSPYALNTDGTPGRALSLAEIERISLANVVLLPDA